jgi:hypothetical protein
VGSSLPPSTLWQVLEPWCAAGASGALRLAGRPGGAIYLAEGRLTYAECGLVTGVDKLLTASGQVSVDVWRAAVAAGRSGRPAGETLVNDGHVSRRDLELVVLSAVLDAALLMFEAPVDAHFEPGVANPIGSFCRLDLRTVAREVDRRREQLTAVWSDPAIDTATVLPSRRIRGHHVALNAVQWEIVANAGRRRSPADLARLLGRETFVVLLEARRLAQAGLIKPGRPGGSAVAESVAAVREQVAAVQDSAPPARDGGAGRDGAARVDGTRVDGTAMAAPVEAGPPLARRSPGGSIPASAGPPVDLVSAVECPDSTLIRIRRALEAMR